MVLLQQQKVTKTIHCHGVWAIVADLTKCFSLFSFLEESGRLWTSKAIEWYKAGLTGHCSRSLEDSSAVSCADYGRLSSRGLRRKKKTISNWARDHFCDVLAIYMAAFCPCPKLESKGLMSLTEEILRQSNIDTVAWLIVIILMQVYSENVHMQQNQIKPNHKCFYLLR